MNCVASIPKRESTAALPSCQCFIFLSRSTRSTWSRSNLIRSGPPIIDGGVQWLRTSKNFTRWHARLKKINKINKTDGDNCQEVTAQLDRSDVTRFNELNVLGRGRKKKSIYTFREKTASGIENVIFENGKWPEQHELENRKEKDVMERRQRGSRKKDTVEWVKVRRATRRKWNWRD